MKPDVSIVIPSYNCSRYLTAAIESALKQTHPALEVFVVDDGSTDDTYDVVRKFPSVIYVRQPNRGVSHARNRALRMVVSEWVLFLDADDYLELTALESLAAAITPACGVVYGDKRTITNDGHPIEVIVNRDCTGPAPAASRTSFGGAAFEPGAAMVSTKLIRQLGGFDQRYCPCDDRHLWIRAGSMAEFAHAPQVVHNYRLRPGSLSKNRVKQVTGSVRVRLDSLEWLAARGVRLFEGESDPAQLLSTDLMSVYWQREWDVVDALLAMADEYDLTNADITKVKWLHRMPEWVGTVKDQFDSWRAS